MLVCAAQLARLARASPGDVLARADFRNQAWLISAPKGTGSAKGMELDFGQNAIKLKDAGSYSWWFESPAAFFKGDMTLAYNGTIEFQLQSLEWESTFSEGYDVVLVSSTKRHTIGVKGIKKDGETSKTYSVRLSEAAGQWEHLHPVLRKDGGGVRAAVVKDDMIKALNTLIAIRVRGGYYMGVEKTQLRSLRVVQGAVASDETAASATGDDCCSDRDRTCTTADKFQLNFANKGLPCIEFTTVSAGTLVAGDQTNDAERTVRLDKAVSSPDADFYRGNKMTITGGKCGPGTVDPAGCSGMVTGYLGQLDWEISSGVTSVEIERGGSNCSGPGFLAANGAGGSGFNASFDVIYTIPEVVLNTGEQGVGCSCSTPETFNTITVDAAGVVQTVTDPADVTGDGYLTGRAFIKCVPPCTGTGLVVDCTADAAGDITALAVTDGGSGYSVANPPTVYCPEGTLAARTSEGPFNTIVTNPAGGDVADRTVTSVTLPAVAGAGYVNGYAKVECVGSCTGFGLSVYCHVDSHENGLAWKYVVGDITSLEVRNPGRGYDAANPPTITCPINEADPPNPGTGFEATFATENGKIIGVSVSNVGSGYNANVKLVSTPQQSTCIGFVFTPKPSGALSSIKVLKVGSGFVKDEPPTLAISSGGAGCLGFTLRTRVGDATPDALVFAATSGGRISLAGTSADYRDGYYNGMTMVMLSGNAAGEVREIKKFSSDGKIVETLTPFTDTPAAGDFYAITKTPALTLKGAANEGGHDFLTGLYDSLAGKLDCGGKDTLAAKEADTAGSGATTTCFVTLAGSASGENDYYLDETIYFPELDLASTIVKYEGASKKAYVAVRGSGATGYNRELLASSSVAANKLYLLSTRHIAKVRLETSSGDTATADTLGTTNGKAAAQTTDAPPDGTSTYTLAYRDYSSVLQSHGRAQPFFCEQAVGADAAFIPLPFTKTFAFRSTPLICSTATLTVAAQGNVRNDILWPGNNITVRGEHGELLGVLFSEPATYLGMQEGGPVYDSITLSQEKMLEMTGDGDIVISLSTDSEHGRPDVVLQTVGGATTSFFPRSDASIKFRAMTLSFSPAACYSSMQPASEWLVRDDAYRAGNTELFYNLSFALPATGAPVSDGVLTVAADADLASGDIEVTYAESGNTTLFSDWVWGKHEEVYAMSEPTNVAVTCENDDDVDLQRYTITGVTITNGGERCSATSTQGPYSTVTVDGAGTVTAITLSDSGGNGYITGRAIITSHGSGNGALEVTCTADANGQVTALTVDTAGTGYSVANPPTVYCPEGTVVAKALPGYELPAAAQNFAGTYATNGILNGGAIIGVTVTNAGTDYPRYIKIVNVPGTLTAATCSEAPDETGIGSPVLAYQKVVAADPAVPARVCKRGTLISINNTRSSRHVAHHRIPRRTLLTASRAGSLAISFRISNAGVAKLTPVSLNYALMHCKLMTLNGKSGVPGIGVPAYRPMNLLLPFQGDAPPAAGAATLWVHATIQNHKPYAADTRGVPNGFPQLLKMDSPNYGQPYYAELERSRDPLSAYKVESRYWPHLGSIRLRAGDKGESVDFMFLKDYSQYETESGYIDSIPIPLRIMEQFALGRKVTFTLEIPPGDSTIIVHSAVLAYPSAEA